MNDELDGCIEILKANSKWKSERIRELEEKLDYYEQDGALIKNVPFETANKIVSLEKELSEYRLANEALARETEDLKAGMGDAKYVKPFSDAMNDYHKAYLNEKHKVDALEEENKCLREQNTMLNDSCIPNEKIIEELEQENKRLRKELDVYIKHCEGDTGLPKVPFTSGEKVTPKTVIYEYLLDMKSNGVSVAETLNKIMEYVKDFMLSTKDDPVVNQDGHTYEDYLKRIELTVEKIWERVFSKL